MYAITAIQKTRIILPVSYAPLVSLGDVNKDNFFKVDEEALFPEVGSRAWVNKFEPKYQDSIGAWNEVQKGNYIYYLSQNNGYTVKIVLRNYLACEIIWD